MRYTVLKLTFFLVAAIAAVSLFYGCRHAQEDDNLNITESTVPREANSASDME